MDRIKIKKSATGVVILSIGAAVAAFLSVLFLFYPSPFSDTYIFDSVRLFITTVIFHMLFCFLGFLLARHLKKLSKVFFKILIIAAPAVLLLAAFLWRYISTMEPGTAFHAGYCFQQLLPVILALSVSSGFSVLVGFIIVKWERWRK